MGHRFGTSLPRRETRAWWQSSGQPPFSAADRHSYAWWLARNPVHRTRGSAAHEGALRREMKRLAGKPGWWMNVLEALSRLP